MEVRSVSVPPKKPRPKLDLGAVLAVVTVFALALVIVLSLTGWAVMVALGIVGISVSFWESVALGALLRFIFISIPRPPGGTS